MTRLFSLFLIALSGCAFAADKPNILVIMPDDVGYWNVGAYSHGMMVPTPNIDRIAEEGMLFTDHYAHPSCTPGRAVRQGLGHLLNHELAFEDVLARQASGCQRFDICLEIRQVE